MCTKRRTVQSHVHPEPQHIRPIRRCDQKLGGRRPRWSSPRTDPTAERSQDADYDTGAVLGVRLEEDRAGMQEGVCVQRDRGGAPGVRRGVATTGRPAGEHLPVADQVRSRQARTTQGAWLLS